MPPLLKSPESCSAMSSSLRLRVIAACSLLLGLQSCEFYSDKDFVKDGASQPELRSLIWKKASIELTEQEKVVNAYSNGGRDPTFWFEVSFAPRQAVSLREMLRQNGYTIRAEQSQITPRITPGKIAAWWNPATMYNPTLFTLQRNKEHSDTDGVWCFFDEVNGRLVASSFTY